MFLSTDDGSRRSSLWEPQLLYMSGSAQNPQVEPLNEAPVQHQLASNQPRACNRLQVVVRNLWR